MKLVRLLFPARCVVCRQLLPSDTGLLQLCGNCLTALYHGQDTVRLIEKDFGCVSAALYPLLRESILRYKFRHDSLSAATFGNLMVLAWRRHQADFPAPEAVTWVPVNSLRRLQRGYDQSELLAQVVAEKLGLPLVCTLTRLRRTRRQERLNTDVARAANVRGVFDLRSSQEYAFHEVLLIDDVVTSGATLREAAWTLRRAGIRCTALCLANARQSESVPPFENLSASLNENGGNKE